MAGQLGRERLWSSRQVPGLHDDDNSLSIVGIRDSLHRKSMNISSLVNSLQRRSGEELGTTISSKLLTPTHAAILDRIRFERMSQLPPEGSDYDKVLAWAQLFVERLHSFDSEIERFAADSYLAAQLAYGYCAMLLELGGENAATLMIPFGFFYRISISLRNLLERIKLFSVTQDIQEQLILALSNLVTLIASVSNLLYKVIRGLPGASLPVNLYHTFSGQTQTLQLRFEEIAESMWKNQLLRENVNGDRISELKAIRPWLAPEDRVVSTFADTSFFAANDRDELTCLWITPYLSRFLKSDKKHLCITGSPGSGKSVLASVIIEHLQHPRGGVSYQTLFVPIDSRIPAQTSPHAIAKSLLSQLFEKSIGNVHLFQILSHAFHRSKVTADYFTYNDILWDAVEYALADSPHAVKGLVVIVDGVDEASCNEGVLLQRLTTATSKSANVKLITLGSQRPHEAPGQSLVQIIDNIIFEDIAAVVRSHLTPSHAFSTLSEIDQETMVENVTNASKGSFVWAKLFARQARQEQNADSLLKVVDSAIISKLGIVNLIGQTLKHTEVSTEAKMMLLWLATANRQLDIKELSILASIQYDKQTISEAHVDVLHILKPVSSLVFVCNDFFFLRHRVIRQAILDIFSQGNLIPSIKDRHANLMTYLMIYIKSTITTQHEPSDNPFLDQHYINTLRERHRLLDFALRYCVPHFRQTVAFTKDKITASKELGKILPTTNTFVLLLRSVWENTTTPELLTCLASITDVYRLVLTDGHVTTLQCVIFLAHVYRQLGRISEASNLFYEAAVTSQKFLTARHVVTMRMATIFLELTLGQITETKTDIMVKREDILLVLLECHKIHHGSTSAEAVSVMKQLVEHYRIVKEAQKAQTITDIIRSITSTEYATTSDDASDSVSAHHVRTGDKDTPIQSEFPSDSGYASAGQNKVEQARTVYSDASSRSTLEKESYISELAEDLFVKALSSQFDAQSLERISEVLPELLKAFALKVGHNAPSQMHRDVMYFIHKNRSYIADCFKDNGFHQDESLPADAHDAERMPLNELMSLWDKNLEDWNDDSISDNVLFTGSVSNRDQIPNQDAILCDADIHESSARDSMSQHSDVGAEEGHEEGASTSQFLAYKDFISKAPAYEWLLATLRRELLLAPAEPNSMEAIRKSIVTSLPSSNKISRKTAAEAYIVTFVTDWNPLAFVKEQGYKEDPDEAVETTITLTGSANDAQALTCAQYLLQTWPSAGGHIMKLVKDVVRAGPANRNTCKSPSLI
ncbi:hypothetical protein BDW59DRAFT_162455 [Aspergillus cavernicola]|uniref:Nephrocystin 3-like N-terminal domain-containing protein n=1 Tax=Aspergillus cavernicola TaxID=176166 RepID=A0ABR4IBK7_9EURO